jgi:hypothetical protein
MTSYTDHFGFNAVPFSKDIDDDKLWLPPSKKSLVSDLVECVQERDRRKSKAIGEGRASIS